MKHDVLYLAQIPVKLVFYLILKEFFGSLLDRELI